MLKPLQASSYTFSHIINGGFLYIDKTRDIYELVRYQSGIYFMSRPRRFGKSLLISTLGEIFRGNQAIFKGLWIHDSDYQWESFPIIRFDFSRGAANSAEHLIQYIDYYVEEMAEEYQIKLRGFDYLTRFDNLIRQLSRDKKVVILIDEYDKPITDNLENLPEAKRIREILKQFYAVIKAMDDRLRFVFITGISKFSKVGIFSAMNHLDDLTMDRRFATLLGITEVEIEQYLTDHLAAFANQAQITTEMLRKKIRSWYNGFRFVENCPAVYNPFSTLQLLKKRRFDNYWFESGTPTFLINLIKSRGYDVRELDRLELTPLEFRSYEVEYLELLPLLFQTGYLTIKSYSPERNSYKLGYPNHEVESAFLAYLLAAFRYPHGGRQSVYLWKLVDALRAHDLDTFFDVLGIFFADIPYDLQLSKEKYYQTIFYLILRMLGIYTQAEVRTNMGRIDTVVELDDAIFIFEFKLNKNSADAIQQIKDNQYPQKYRLQNKPLTLVGVNFDSQKRTISDWTYELDT